MKSTKRTSSKITQAKRIPKNKWLTGASLISHLYFNLHEWTNWITEGDGYSAAYRCKHCGEIGFKEFGTVREHRVKSEARYWKGLPQREIVIALKQHHKVLAVIKQNE